MFASCIEGWKRPLGRKRAASRTRQSRYVRVPSRTEENGHWGILES